MTWNYRVIRRDIDGEIELGIYEVYYDEDGRITAWTLSSVNVVGESIVDLEAELLRMRIALGMGVLDYDELEPVTSAADGVTDTTEEKENDTND